MSIRIAVALLALALAGGALYWLLVLTEGSYLGKRAVAFLYDRSAHEYDEIKKFDQEDDAWRIGEPLLAHLGSDPNSLVLDIATGTGRVPQLLLNSPSFQGRIIGVDISQEMLQEAWQKTRLWAERLELIWHDASDFLPFGEDTFDAVILLEALEFFPHPRAALQEMVRVLRPGGRLLVTNRVGVDYFFFPGRASNRTRFERELEALGLEVVVTHRWQTYYDLVWAHKPAQQDTPPPKPFALLCPACKYSSLEANSAGYTCPACHREYPSHDGLTLLRAP